MRKTIVKRVAACLLGAAMLLTQPGIASVTEAAGKVSSFKKEGEITLTNGDFENETEGWKAEPEPGTFKVTEETGGKALNFYDAAGTEFKCVQVIESLPAGTYKVTAQSQGAGGEKVYVYLNGEKGDVFQEDSGWANWTESSGTFVVAEDLANVEVGVYVECKAEAWGHIDNISIKAVSGDAEETPAPPVESSTPTETASPSQPAIPSELFIKKIDNYDEKSIRGMDVSSYLSIMDAFEKVRENMKAAGASEEEINKVGFKDDNGNVLDEQGFFDFLAKSGVNYIRLRVWNNPYDADGNGYGGGNNDIDKAIEMGKYITKAGMKVLIDFHLSDFWADPGKQKAPKAWADYTVDQKVTAVSDYITDSLTKLVKDNGVDVAMVQVGNETNGAVCGVTEWADMNKIFDAGCDAVHAVDKDILAAVHFTNPEKDGLLMSYAANLDDYDGDGDGTKEGVSYDLFASSYYPNSHGTMENLTNVLSNVAKTYDKYVMVAETSWANTRNLAHSANQSSFQTGDYVNYNVTVQGQANAIRDVANAVNNVDATLSNGEKAALGFFYWEPAWISAMSVYDENGNLKVDAEQIEAALKEIDVECGSGWASSYSVEYDPDDAGYWWGASGMTEQSVFDFNGNPLPVLDVYNPDCLKYGAEASAVKPDGYTVEEISIETGQTVDSVLPKVTVTYNDSTEEQKEVNWNKEDVARVNESAATTAGIGTYTVNGTLADDASYAVVVTVNVIGINLLADPGFENADSAWTVTGEGGAVKSGEDKRTGEMCLHFYSDSDFKFNASTTTTVTKPGYYNAFIYMQGLASAGTRDGESLRLLAVTGDGKEYASESTTLTGWVNWKQVKVDDIYVSEDMIKNGQNTITLSVDAVMNAGAWGTMDDASLYLNKEEVPGVPEIIEQVITAKSSYTKTYGDKAFSLNAKAEGALTYETNNKAVATVSKSGKVTIKGAGVAVITVKAAATEKYTAASKKITITVKPKKVSGVKAKAAKKKVTVSWKKAAKAAGYQIQYSTSKNFKGAKTVTASGTSKVIKGLKSKKTYYVRVCAYAKNGKKKVMGAYSSKVKVKVK